jgi:hypothetical protein
MNSVILGSLLGAGFYIPVNNIDIFSNHPSKDSSLYVTQNS